MQDLLLEYVNDTTTNACQIFCFWQLLSALLLCYIIISRMLYIEGAMSYSITLDSCMSRGHYFIYTILNHLAAWHLQFLQYLGHLHDVILLRVLESGFFISIWPYQGNSMNYDLGEWYEISQCSQSMGFHGAIGHQEMFPLLIFSSENQF